MTETMPPAPDTAAAITGQTLTRADISALAATRTPVHLIDCDADEADFGKLDLTGWKFERCTFRRTRFVEAGLEGTTWLNCRGGFADFSRADLSIAVFRASDFNNGVFRHALLTSAAFEGCKLTGADLSEIRAMDIRFEETLLINARLAAYSFRNARLTKVDFAQADLRKCDFRATVFQDCSLRDANMMGCRFEGADLRGADLGGLRLIDASLFKGATISREQAGQLLGQLGLNVK